MSQNVLCSIVIAKLSKRTDMYVYFIYEIETIAEFNKLTSINSANSQQ